MAGILALVVALGAPSLHAGAQEDRPVEASAELWLEVRRPGWIRASALVRQALDRYADAQRAALFDRSAAFPIAYLEAAEARLERAVAYAPEDPVAAFLLARVSLSLADRRGSDALRAEAVARFEAVRAVDPAFEASAVAAALAVLHTRAHRFEDALREHALSLRRSLDPSRQWTETANLAEATMLAGDLPRAVALYERALRLAEVHGPNVTIGPRNVWVGALALWGLAVALDRLGEHDAALERAAEALRLGPNLASLELLRDEAVFFEPGEEIHWYEAIAWEAVARDATDPQDAAEATERARQRWRRYLVRGGDDARWADLARWHLERLPSPGTR